MTRLIALSLMLAPIPALACDMNATWEEYTACADQRRQAGETNDQLGRTADEIQRLRVQQQMNEPLFDERRR